MRKVSLLGVLVSLVLVAGCGPMVVTPRAGQLVYITTFDAYNEDCQLYEGELSTQIVTVDDNPMLQIAVDSFQEGAFTLLESPQFTDFDAIVQTAQVAGPDDNGFGLLFRHQDNDNFYLFMISGDGYYRVSRRLEGQDTVLSDWVPSPAIAQGTVTNTIRVVAQGDQFRFYINDTQVPLCTTIWNPVVPGECQVSGSAAEGQATYSTEATIMTLTDDSLPQGRIGLGARSFDVQGVHINFDNLIVCGPQDDPPVPYHCEESLDDL